MEAAYRITFWLILISFSSSGNSLDISNPPRDTSTFELVRQADGIYLYERWYPLKPDLLAREIKATFSIRATPDAAVALIKDASRGREWNKNTCAYDIIDLKDESWTSYIQYDLPWPVSNQDCVLQYDKKITSDTTSVIFRGVPHPLFPESNRIQRIKELQGKWVFVKSGNEYQVEYFITTTPSKTLPGWVTDPIIRNNLLETLAAFRSLVEAGE